MEYPPYAKPMLLTGLTLLTLCVLLGSYVLFTMEYAQAPVEEVQTAERGPTEAEIKAQLERLKNHDPNYVPPTEEEVIAQLSALAPEDTTPRPSEEEIQRQLEALKR